ncbi:MAG TPA: hypothetical protein VGD50_03020, partial [Candidatus Baltobacteraceae bacterium]
GLGIIMVTHDLGDIIPEIGRVILMRDGRIIADDEKRSVLTSEQLSELFGTRVGLLQNGEYYAMQMF